MSPEQAKRQLRAVAQRASPSTWVRGHPLEALAGGFMAGLLYGGGKAPRASLDRLILLWLRLRAY
jgi:hypothetical protein